MDWFCPESSHVTCFVIVKSTRYLQYLGSPLGPCGPGGPGGPGGPCGPFPFYYLYIFPIIEFKCLQNSTELTKKPSNGPVLHSYLFSSSWIFAIHIIIIIISTIFLCFYVWKSYASKRFITLSMYPSLKIN